jgi:hypothetical protein
VASRSSPAGWSRHSPDQSGLVLATLPPSRRAKALLWRDGGQLPFQHGTGKSREPAEKNVCATSKANGKSIRFFLPPITTRYMPKLMVEIHLWQKTQPVKLPPTTNNLISRNL